MCRSGRGQPPLPTRLVAGLLILKHMHDLSDEAFGTVRTLDRERPNRLEGRHGVRTNALLAAVSDNFGLLLRWFERILRALWAAVLTAVLSLRFA